jgi:hypothetical protein
VCDVVVATVASSRLCGCVSYSVYSMATARIHELLRTFRQRIKISSK